MRFLKKYKDELNKKKDPKFYVIGVNFCNDENIIHSAVVYEASTNSE